MIESGIAEYLAKIGKKGGKAKTSKKRISSLKNLQKANLKRIGRKAIKIPPSRSKSIKNPSNCEFKNAK